MKSISLVVHGRVQGVFYRNWTVGAARELGLSGWVRNRPDGSVEALLQGDAYQVDAMIARMHDGPPAARVERIEQSPAEPENLDSFDRR